MKPLFVLLIVSGLSFILLNTMYQMHDFGLAARIGMSAMLLFTGIAHFAFTRGMALMLPEVVPYKTVVIYLTGVMEISFGIGLLIPSVRILTAWLLIVFFIVLLPANIRAAALRLDYQKGTYTGSGLNYLWFRVPLQVFFIVWTYLSAVR